MLTLKGAPCLQVSRARPRRPHSSSFAQYMANESLGQMPVTHASRQELLRELR